MKISTAQLYVSSEIVFNFLVQFCLNLSLLPNKWIDAWLN